ncbi:hypothetical protein KGY79_05085 [Candidatus Bipolaricaulota bacterium]|nr:hypothetical protein [Candidatus Bipolaricaulota bacterium]
MVHENGTWKDDEVKDFIWKHLCNSKNGRFDFAPLLFNADRETPGSPQLAKTIAQMEEKNYIADKRPNYGHYWVKLKGSGKRKCPKKIKQFKNDNVE